MSDQTAERSRKRRRTIVAIGVAVLVVGIALIGARLVRGTDRKSVGKAMDACIGVGDPRDWIQERDDGRTLVAVVGPDEIATMDCVFKRLDAPKAARDNLAMTLLIGGDAKDSRGAGYLFSVAPDPTVRNGVLVKVSAD